MACVFGILLWLPGVSYSITKTIHLQPVEIFVLLWFGFGIFPRLRFAAREYADRELLIICGVICVSWVISTVWSIDRLASLRYVTYYGLIILPAMLFFYRVAHTDKLFAQFLSGFLLGATLSAALGFFQAALGPRMLRLVNNENFALVHGLHKASGFTPEASILAGLLIIAIMVLLLLLTSVERRDTLKRCNAPPYLTSGTSLTVLLVITLAGLFSTLSSSVIVVLPVCALAGYLLSSRVLRLRSLLLGILCISLVVAVFMHTAWATRSIADSHGSILLRFASMTAAFDISVSNWLTGVGLGMLSRVIGAPIEQIMRAKYLDSDLPSIAYIAKDGVDSFILHLIAEQGILILFAFIIALMSIFLARYGAPRSESDREITAMIAVLAMSSFIVGALTVGYRGLIHLWLLFPAACAIQSRRSSGLHATNK
jgi:hypothetical protein